MWTIETLNATVDAELNALPIDMRAKFERICDLIRSVGLTHVGEPYTKPLSDKLWEMRMSGKSGISRAIYITRIGRRIVILRAFVKKTQKTPPSEITLAKQRARSLITRSANDTD